MSNLVFPNYLPGILFTQKKSPTFDTAIHAALTGKESRISRRAFPLYKWELSYELLRDYADGKFNLVPYALDLTQWTVANGSSATDYSPVVDADYALAPDGTLTADRVVLNKGAGSTVNDLSEVYANVSLPAVGVYTASVYLRTLDGSTVSVLLGNGFTPQLVSVTPSWQRFSATFTATGVQAYIGLILQGTTGSSNYACLAAWGAQVEAGATASGLIPTRGAAIVAGDLKTLFGLFNQMLGQQDTFLYRDPDFNTVSLCQFGTGNGSQTVYPLTATYQPFTSYALASSLAYLPELVQDPDGPPDVYVVRYGAPELLGSSARTNLALQDRFGGTWTGSNATVTANAGTAPDGLSTAATINDGAAAGVHAAQQTAITITGGGRYTFSCFLKDSTHQYATLTLDNGSTNGVTATFDLVNGTASSVLTNGTAYASNADVSIVSFGSGWYRCSISGQLANTDTTARLSIGFAQNANAAWFPSFTGASTVLLAWGAQLEAGGIPTALIHTTTGSASSTDYALNGTSVLTFSSAPANGAKLVWSGSFFYRCRFSADSIDFSAFAYQFWELKKIAFQQVKR